MWPDTSEGAERSSGAPRSQVQRGDGQQLSLISPGVRGQVRRTQVVVLIKAFTKKGVHTRFSSHLHARRRAQSLSLAGPTY